MNQRVAILDLGTNTFHLLIADIGKEKAPVEIIKETIPVKLGEGGIASGIISEAAFARGINAINHFSEIVKASDVNQILAVGTAALRSAKNGAEFISQVYDHTGISIEIIDGDKEAELIYEGVRHAVKLPEDPVIIVDIGGGSVEFIICNKDQIFWKQSRPIGAAKLMAMFHHSDPISEADTADIHRFFDEQLVELKQAVEKFKPETLIGSAGSFETFAELEVIEYDLAKERLRRTEFIFNMERFGSISYALLKTTHLQRELMRGLPEVRVDMIIVSAILTRYLIREFNFGKMILSAYSLKEGLLFQGQ